MGRPRKPDALTSAERVRAFRLRQRLIVAECVAKTIPVKECVTKTICGIEPVTEIPFGSFCEWFPWAKGCSLDLIGRGPHNVVTPAHRRFACKGDPLHADYWLRSKATA